MTDSAVDDVVAVVYPQTGALRVYANMALAKMHVAPSELARYGLRSALDLKRNFAHDRLEALWVKLFEHMVWGLPKTAVGPEPADSEKSPPDCGTDLLADQLWDLMLRVGDRITQATTTQKQSRDQYQIFTAKIAALLDDPEACKAYPKQCRQILGAMRDLKDEFVHEDRIKRMMNELVTYGGFRTKQDPFLIFAFYRKRLIDDGLFLRGGESQGDDA
jgi:hypothetical protein